MKKFQLKLLCARHELPNVYRNHETDEFYQVELEVPLPLDLRLEERSLEVKSGHFRM